ncbi:type IV pilus biogenesis protein PilM [Herbaspirillum sp. alder98]|uniref:type IV pilus biogenesis protein PilM n=1 Tax=Herbaspirillum sp. alder98 TaxID=2913096 RepID=UPI001CD89BA9|nr:type IV pilus biogenesis protein PilM [Herbaspirillum sp. alder98]MCA1325640.1 type IV pilus biogenesis protein PilM [Herbaspirillum sp. alder98]
MWNAAVVAILIAVAGIYATRNAQALDGAQAGLAASRAAEMGIYRNAVINYFSAHDSSPGVVSTAALKSGGYLPSWSRLYQQSTPLAWSNYRDADGIIYIYATALPERNLTAELASLAQNSVLFGLYDSTTNKLQSPVAGNTNIPTTAISAMSIPNGAPVWIAMIK